MLKSHRFALPVILVLALSSGAVFGQATSRGLLEDELEAVSRARAKAQTELNEAKSQLNALQQAIQNGNDPPQVGLMLRNDREFGNIRDTCKAYEDAMDSLSWKYGENSPIVKEYAKRREAAQARLLTVEARLRATYRQQILDAQSSIVSSLSTQELALAKQQNELRVEIRQPRVDRPVGIMGLKDLSPEQRRKIDEINKRRDAEIMQVLTDDQRKQLQDR